GPPKPSEAIVEMICAADRPASLSRSICNSSASASGAGRISPPADITSALIQTVYASARMPCTPRYLSCSLAASMICCQVTGSFAGSRPACSATDSRYQSSCVLAQNGATTSSSCQVENSSAPCTTSAVTVSTTSSGTGASQSASANSGM